MLPIATKILTVCERRLARETTTYGFFFFLVGFFVRDPSSLIGLPTDARSQFVDQTSEAKVRRDVLLTKLKSKFPVLHDSVNCSKGTPADVSPPPRIKSSNTSAGY